MRTLTFALLAGLLLAVTPSAAAQDDETVIYMSQYEIQPQRMDSLMALTTKYDQPWHNFVAEKVPGYQRYFMRHDTGDEHNFMIATIYPDWDMIDDMPYDELFPQFAESMGMTVEEFEGSGVEEGFEWAFEGATHEDQIWRPIASTRRTVTPEMLSDAVFYMTQFKIKGGGRLDSLATLTTEYDQPWHDFVAERVPGYERHWMRHDTGNEYNFLVATTYPSWDMVDSVPFDELWPDFVESQGMTVEEMEEMEEEMGVEKGFRWAYEGAQHMDQIWRPVVTDDTEVAEMTSDEEMNEE